MVPGIKNGGIDFAESTSLTRRLDIGVEDLVRGGDFRELCGLKVLGRGECIYWGIVPQGSERLGCAFPRRFGILGVPLGEVEITDPALELLVVDDEQARPVVTLHRHGKGKCCFINTWAYPGALGVDEGPGSLRGSGGLFGTLCRAIANESRGHVWITDDKAKPGRECDYVRSATSPRAARSAC